eukprot:GHVP01041549.1.p1 GENE.GHVP01041549.1~~GHVP01041549.1.p1  ORF type:complete len:744 (+),score=118.65 GHVP01041549.1:2126-4357(+)
MKAWLTKLIEGGGKKPQTVAAPLPLKTAEESILIGVLNAKGLSVGSRTGIRAKFSIPGSKECDLTKFSMGQNPSWNQHIILPYEEDEQCSKNLRVEIQDSNEKVVAKGTTSIKYIKSNNYEGSILLHPSGRLFLTASFDPGILAQLEVSGFELEELNLTHQKGGLYLLVFYNSSIQLETDTIPLNNDLSFEGRFLLTIPWKQKSPFTLEFKLYEERDFSDRELGNGKLDIKQHVQTMALGSISLLSTFMVATNHTKKIAKIRWKMLLRERCPPKVLKALQFDGSKAHRKMETSETLWLKRQSLSITGRDPNMLGDSKHMFFYGGTMSGDMFAKKCKDWIQESESHLNFVSICHSLIENVKVSFPKIASKLEMSVIGTENEMSENKKHLEILYDENKSNIHLVDDDIVEDAAKTLIATRGAETTLTRTINRPIIRCMEALRAQILDFLDQSQFYSNLIKDVALQASYEYGGCLNMIKVDERFGGTRAHNLEKRAEHFRKIFAECADAKREAEAVLASAINIPKEADNCIPKNYLYLSIEDLNEKFDKLRELKSTSKKIANYILELVRDVRCKLKHEILKEDTAYNEFLHSPKGKLYKKTIAKNVSKPVTDLPKQWSSERYKTPAFAESATDWDDLARKLFAHFESTNLRQEKFIPPDKFVTSLVFSAERVKAGDPRKSPVITGLDTKSDPTCRWEFSTHKGDIRYERVPVLETQPSIFSDVSPENRFFDRFRALCDFLKCLDVF